MRVQRSLAQSLTLSPPPARSTRARLPPRRTLVRTSCARQPSPCPAARAGPLCEFSVHPHKYPMSKRPISQMGTLRLTRTSPCQGESWSGRPSGAHCTAGRVPAAPSAVKPGPGLGVSGQCPHPCPPVRPADTCLPGPREPSPRGFQPVGGGRNRRINRGAGGLAGLRGAGGSGPRLGQSPRTLPHAAAVCKL